MTGGVLVVTEDNGSELRDVTREAITAGRQLKEQSDGPLVVAIVTHEPSQFVEGVSLEGVDEVVEVPLASAGFNAEAISFALEAAVRAYRPRLVLMGHTTQGMVIGPALAVRLDFGFVSDLVACSVEGGQVVGRRQFYGGKVEADVELRADVPAVLLLRPGAWPQTTPTGSPAVTSLPPVMGQDPTRIRYLGTTYPERDDVDISVADVIVAIGRGIGEPHNVERVEALASRMGVALAASRPLVDAGWVVKSRQVGQSGITVSPKLYIALGISGAREHVAGMKGSERVVAVNRDPQAPIFGVADLGAVADLFEVVAALEQLW
jgi:electron transfer flavoprotein alpha subunit